MQIRRLSSFINWLIYYFVYVPAVLYPVLQGLRGDTLLLSLALCASFMLIIVIAKMGRSSFNIQVRPGTFKLIFVTAYLTLIAYSVAIFWGSFSLVDITDVYDQRSLAGDVSKGTFVGYAAGWLSGCFNPLLMGIGLRYKNRLLFVAGAIGQVFVYSTFAMKSILLSVVIILVLYYLVLRKETISFRGIAAFSLASVLVPLLISMIINEDSSLVFENISAIIFMRTYGMVGGLTGTYYDFFSQNPHTYYSHINVVGTLVSYPYTDSIGEIIGASMGLYMNANANFFATDGIAAAGLFGVVLIGCVIGLTLRWLDALIPRENLHLTCITVIPGIVSLSNASFFTTLLTGGLFLSVVFCGAWRAGGVRRYQLLANLPSRT